MRLFKSKSGANGKQQRPKSGQQQSIRGKISAPIPIPNPLDDDEFPIRHPGSAKASTTADDEFPIRSPGAGIASPTPLASPDIPRSDAPPPNALGEPTEAEGEALTAADEPVSVEASVAAPKASPETPGEDIKHEPQPATPPQQDAPGAVDEVPAESHDGGVLGAPPEEKEPDHAKTIQEPVAFGPPPVPPPTSAPPEPPLSLDDPQRAPAQEQPLEAVSEPAAVASDTEQLPAQANPSDEIVAEPPALIPESEAPLTRTSPPRKPAQVRTSPPRKISPARRVSPSRRASPVRRRSPARTGPPVAMRRTNRTSTVRYSAASAASTVGTGNSKDAMPQRKKSTLRSAFSKLFGRKKKSTSQTSSELSRMSGLPGSAQHHSDPTALGGNRNGELEPKRSASLPITELDRALRSHSVGPDDITTIEEVRNSMHGSFTSNRKRAVSTTSRLFTHPRIHTGEWGLTPRPASAHGKGGQQHRPTSPEDPSQIGMAITSDNAAASNRRRSRSLSGLPDVADGQLQPRKRSDEIRYWRASYDPGYMSPLSSNAQEDMDGDQDETGTRDASVPASPVVEHPPKTPPQPFNFGSIPKEMAGMKITQAATLDSRIASLENRMVSLERLLEQLLQAVPGFNQSTPANQQRAASSTRVASGSTGLPVVYGRNVASPMVPAMSQAISEDLKGASFYSSSHYSRDDDGQQSQISFGEAPTYISSQYPPSISLAQSTTLTASPGLHVPRSSEADRPNSTSTVRGATSMPSIGRGPTSGSPEQVSALHSQLEAERAARQTLDAQVRKLSERLNVLSSTLFTMVRDPQKSKSTERLAGKVQSGSIAVQPPHPASNASHKTASVFETDDEETDDDKGRASGSESLPRGLRARPPTLGGAPPLPRRMDSEMTEDEDLSDNFQTPREEQPQQQLYGAFGEELRDDDTDGKRRKAARTLSLSQLTLGKGAVPQV